jgi:ketosteroid isomerase-like protein
VEVRYAKKEQNGLSVDQLLIIGEIQQLHLERGEAYVRREVERYLSYYWDDAIVFGVDGRASVAEMRSSFVTVLQAGGGPLSIDLPPADDIVISTQGDAATASYNWRSTFRASDGITSDRLSYETNVWYQRSSVWRIIRMHLTRLSTTPV